MGIFTVDIRVAKPGRRPKWAEFKRVIVDTGSEVTRLPEENLRAIGIEIFKKDQPFITANGQRITRDVGIAVIQCGEFKTVDEVMFARPGDLLLLGARTLEGFNATVDPRKKKLVAAGPLPAARVTEPYFLQPIEKDGRE
jgi:predicted aspartyl protease